MYIEIKKLNFKFWKNTNHNKYAKFIVFTKFIHLTFKK